MTNVFDSPNLEKIKNDGQHYLLSQYALKDELMSRINETFLDGIEKLESLACRRAVEKNGLRHMHQHFPVEKVKLLEAYILRHLRSELYYWSAKVGTDDLGIEGEFFIDHLIVIRIHYPHLVARKARPGDILPAPPAWAEKARLGIAALKNWRMLGHHFRRMREKRRAMKQATKAKDYDARAYHGDLASPARAHGAHVDTWYGHSYDGVNLWLSIDGVNERNTVILYPELFGRKLDFDPVSMYLAPGQPTSKPLKHAMEPGQLLVFNPEILHGTQVNISDETRVALTTRINPNPPRFAEAAPFHFEYWYSSKDLAKRRFMTMSVFPHKDYQGEPSWTQRESYTHDNARHFVLDTPLEGSAEVDVCAVEDLTPGLKLSVDAGRAKILLWRTDDGIRAYSRNCPHLGIDIADGYHDDRQIFCPGHGMSFSLESGESPCTAFRLKQYRAEERNGRIYVARARKDTGDPALPQQAAE